MPLRMSRRLIHVGVPIVPTIPRRVVYPGVFLGRAYVRPNASSRTFRESAGDGRRCFPLGLASTLFAGSQRCGAVSTANKGHSRATPIGDRRIGPLSVSRQLVQCGNGLSSIPQGRSSYHRRWQQIHTSADPRIAGRQRRPDGRR